MLTLHSRSEALTNRQPANALRSACRSSQRDEDVGEWQ